jgi:hypothetical protein
MIDFSDSGVIDTSRELLRFISRERELLAGDIGFQFATDRSLLHRHERELTRAALDLLSRSDRRETARCSDRTWREVVCSKALRVSNMGFRHIMSRDTFAPSREGSWGGGGEWASSIFTSFSRYFKIAWRRRQAASDPFAMHARVWFVANRSCRNNNV